MTLEEDVGHEAVLIHCFLSLVSDAIDARMHINQMPPRTTPLFPVSQALGEEGAEFETPFA